MSSQPGPISGDMGIGLCLVCVLEHRAALAARAADKKSAPTPPRFAVTQAPMPYPVPAPDGAGFAGIAGVVVPVCYDHAPGGKPAQQRGPRLVVASGGTIG